jgi:glutaminyl-peptide cyclotransferase
MSRVVRTLLVAGLIGAVATFGFLLRPWGGQAGERPLDFDPDKPAKPDKFAQDRGGAPEAPMPPFDSDRVMAYLKQLCDIGPRVSGTAGMTKQIELLTKHFEKHGGTVRKQTFEAKQRSQSAKVGMTNLIVSWFPDRPRRVILCSHYDTRPRAHEEPNRTDWVKPFVSANDGTSGVAMLMELAHTIGTLTTPVGVDFVLFDGEEYVFEPTGPLGGGDKFFFGSDHFADDYAASKATRKFTYEAAILFDLFAHPGAKFPAEEYSYAKAPDLVTAFWTAAVAVRATSFQNLVGGGVQDDHLALNRVGIPAIDVIDFDGYRQHWHRLSDTPDKCDGKQIAEVARVTVRWLTTLR